MKDWHFKLQVPKVPWAICQLPKTSWTLPLLVCGPLDNAHQYHSYLKIIKVWLAYLIWFQNWQAIYWHKFKPWKQAVKKDDYSQKKKVTIFFASVALSTSWKDTVPRRSLLQSMLCTWDVITLYPTHYTIRPWKYWNLFSSAANMIHTSLLQKDQWPFQWISIHMPCCINTKSV